MWTWISRISRARRGGRTVGRGPAPHRAAALLLAAAGAVAVAPAARPAPGPADAPLSPADVNGAPFDPALDRAGGSPALVRAQILLDRANFSPGEIDGRWGSNLRRAIAGYQRSAELPDTGAMDGATWALLTAGGGDAVVAYTIADADVAGPFTPVPRDMVAKSRLPALGYTSPLEALGERFHASPALLQRLNPGARFAAGESIEVPNVADATLPAAAEVVVDASDASLRLLDADGRVYAQFPASTGSAHDPLPAGEWSVEGVFWNPVFHYNPELFWDADPRHSKADVAPGPNNPVGVVWVALSKPHYGIHGTPEPAHIGKTQSHGCIRLTNWSARALANAVAPGTPVVLQP